MYGLVPDDYRLAELEALRTEALVFRFTTPERLDILLTDAFLTMARHLGWGRPVPARSGQAPAADTTLAALLMKALKTGQIRQALESVEPCHPQYLALKAELQRLQMQPAPAKADLARQRTLSINMDRWRWEDRMFPSRYLMVNIPAYTLAVMEGDTAVLRSKVIVGSKDNPTPELQSTIWCFTVYPYWNVPRSIAVKEMLPRLKTDSSYLNRHFYEVLDARGNVLDASAIDWLAYDENNFPYYFRQREGRDNSLGVVKFTFDNPHSVFLHDTNAPHLFARSQRALSHGCVRVEKAKQLAYYLVKNDTIFSNPELLAKYFELSKRTEVSLIQPIPIFIRYFTAWADGDEVVYYNDVYGKDGEVIF
jgi:murein L,D-transpeptidase YcbB/YkuD